MTTTNQTTKPHPHRRTKLTPELQDRICNLISHGNYIETSCRACGISDNCFYDWLQRGQDTNDRNYELYHGFYCAVKEAEATAECKIVQQVVDQVPQQWAAGMTLLERRHPSRWGRRNESTVSGTIQIQLVEVEDGNDTLRSRITGVTSTPQLAAPCSDTIDAECADVTTTSVIDK